MLDTWPLASLPVFRQDADLRTERGTQDTGLCACSTLNITRRRKGIFSEGTCFLPLKECASLKQIIAIMSSATSLNSSS